MNNTISVCQLWLLLLCLAIFTGCQPSESETVRRLAENTVHEQAKQNLRIADATESLVKADSEARSAMIEAHGQLQSTLQTERVAIIEAHGQLQSKLQTERVMLDQRRSDLDSLKNQIEDDRRQDEHDRRRAHIVAESIKSVGGILACLCPLLLAAYVLFSMNKTIEADQEKIVNQFLIQELTSASPTLLPLISSTRQIEDQRELMAVLESEVDSDDEPPF